MEWPADVRTASRVAVAYTQTWLARIFSASSVAGSSPDPFGTKAASPVTMATQSFAGKRSAFRSQKVIEALNSSAWTWSMSVPWSAEPTTVAVVLLAGLTAAVEKDAGQCDRAEEGVLASRHG